MDDSKKPKKNKTLEKTIIVQNTQNEKRNNAWAPYEREFQVGARSYPAQNDVRGYYSFVELSNNDYTLRKCLREIKSIKIQAF